jgi:hypothetical protein
VDLNQLRIEDPAGIHGWGPVAGTIHTLRWRIVLQSTQ